MRRDEQNYFTEEEDFRDETGNILSDGQLGKASLKDYVATKLGQANQVDYKFYSLSKKGKIIAFTVISVILLTVITILWILMT